MEGTRIHAAVTAGRRLPFKDVAPPPALSRDEPVLWPASLSRRQSLVKKPNYGFEKRRKEMDRKKKQEEKRQRKTDTNDAPQQSDNSPLPMPRDGRDGN